MTLNEIKMTLNEINQTQDAFGFKVKSLKTGKIWKVDSATTKGGFIISNEDKESLVKGDVDRYELMLEVVEDNTERIEELTTALTALFTERARVNGILFDIQAEVEELNTELTELQTA